jgi:hypothetical protein
MMILNEFGSRQSRGLFWRAQVWAVERLICLPGSSGDLRWAVAGLALRAFAALEAVAKRQLICLVRHVMGRAWRGARFASGMTNADSMVAAGGN